MHASYVACAVVSVKLKTSVEVENVSFVHAITLTVIFPEKLNCKLMLCYVKHGLSYVSIPSLGSFETGMLPS